MSPASQYIVGERQMPESEKIYVLCKDTICRLGSPLTLDNGTVVPAGSAVLLLPQTVADCVLTPDGDSLSEAWPTISRDGHSHEEIAKFSAELIRFSTRLTGVESALIEVSDQIIRFATRLEKIEERFAELDSAK